MIRKWFDRIRAKTIVAINSIAKNEDGDTNFISILIILGIVILLATLFIVFKDKIVNMVTDIVNSFTL